MPEEPENNGESEEGNTIASIPTPQQQLQMIRQHIPLASGDSWYLLDKAWVRKWEDYCANSGDVNNPEHRFFPGCINNEHLLTAKGELSAHVMEAIDYELFHQRHWDLLTSWYGADSNSVLERKVITTMHYSTEKLEIEIRPKKFSIHRGHVNISPVHIYMSKVSTFGQLKQKIMEIFNIPENQFIRIWSMIGLTKDRPITDMDKQLDSYSGFIEEDVGIFVQETEDENNENVSMNSSPGVSKFPGKGQTLGSSTDGSSSGSSTYYNSHSYNNSSSTYLSSNSDSYYSKRVKRGLCGLSNLGNTCFMNSALQCLNNTAPLVEYFVSDKYVPELNKTNPLGMQGEIAEEYAKLVKAVWSGYDSAFSPRDFKYTIGRFAPQFSGYAQHDSQELLGFLLDGLHEDLNRIIKKPYIEQTESNDRPEKEIADETWQNHKKRNDSIIVDLFQGQFKSRVTCPDCNKVSVTFDPSMYLSLPLPVVNMKVITVLLVYHDEKRKSLEVKVDVPKSATISTLCKRLAELTDLAADKLVVTEVYDHKFYQVYRSDSNVADVRDSDVVVAFEVLAAVPIPSQTTYSTYPSRRNDDEDEFTVVDHHRKNKAQNQESNIINIRLHLQLAEQYQHYGKLFGTPFVLSLPKEIIYADFVREIKRVLSRYVEIPTATATAMDVDNQGEAFTFHILSTSSSYTFDNVTVTDQGETPISLNASNIYVAQFSQVVYDYYFRDVVKEGAFMESFDQHPNMTETAASKTDITLLQCLNLFSREERLGKDNAWYCPQCKEHKEASKKMDLWRLPEILVIHLKRFSYNSYSRDKIDAFVDFPISGLDLTGFSLGPQDIPPIYDLFAVSNHFGGLGGGHYTAYAKNKDDGQWNNFDDSYVSSADEASVKTKAAYVLFYRRRPGPHAQSIVSPTTPSAEGSTDMEEDTHTIADDNTD